MKRFFVFLFVLVYLLSGCSQVSRREEEASEALITEEGIDSHNYNFDGAEYITFYPSGASDFNIESIQADFLKSQYYCEKYEYKEYYNYMPEEISKAYELDAFQVVYNRGSYVFAVSFIRYKGEIYPVERFGTSHPEGSGFAHFALTDINSDGYFELLSSYTTYWYSGGEENFQTKITVLDSKSGICKTQIGCCTDGYLYFKPDEDNRIGAYVSAKKDVHNADTLYTEFLVNPSRYQFLTKEFSKQATNYKVDVTIDESSLAFPVRFKGVEIGFAVNVRMTYLGETFTYTNATTYCKSAEPRFENAENKIQMDGFFEGQAITTFTIEKGQVLDRSYDFSYGYYELDKEGVYDLYIEYRGEEISIPAFLTVTGVQ